MQGRTDVGQNEYTQVMADAGHNIYRAEQMQDWTNAGHMSRTGQVQGRTATGQGGCMAEQMQDTKKDAGQVKFST